MSTKKGPKKVPKGNDVRRGGKTKNPKKHFEDPDNLSEVDSDMREETNSLVI